VIRAVDGGDNEGIVKLLRQDVCAKVLLTCQVTAKSEASTSPHLTVTRGWSKIPQREHCSIQLSDHHNVK